MLKDNKKFIFGIPWRVIKIVGLVLLVAAQAIPLGAFEGHIVSVTAFIDPPRVDSPASQGLAVVEGAQIFNEGVASSTADLASGAIESNGTTSEPVIEVVQTDFSDSASTTLSNDATTTSSDTGAGAATTDGQFTPPAETPAVDSAVASGTDGPGEILTTKIEIISEETQLVIENSGALELGTSE